MTPPSTFFSYEVHEALHLSERERQVVLDCFSKIDFELQYGVDKHSKKLVVTNIELFLNYCLRFYDRQFITRETVHKGILEKFEHLLNDYFEAGKPVNQVACELDFKYPQHFTRWFKQRVGHTPNEYRALN